MQAVVSVCTKAVGPATLPHLQLLVQWCLWLDHSGCVEGGIGGGSSRGIAGAALTLRGGEDQRVKCVNVSGGGRAAGWQKAVALILKRLPMPAANSISSGTSVCGVLWIFPSQAGERLGAGAEREHRVSFQVSQPQCFRDFTKKKKKKKGKSTFLNATSIF